MSDDLISRMAAIDALEEYLEEYDGLDERGLHSEKWCAMSEAKMAIEALPSVQPERKKGRWIVIVKGCKLTSYKCSECGRYIADDTGYDVKKAYPFCHCGADMREENNE